MRAGDVYAARRSSAEQCGLAAAAFGVALRAGAAAWRVASAVEHAEKQGLPAEVFFTPCTRTSAGKNVALAARDDCLSTEDV